MTENSAPDSPTPPLFGTLLASRPSRDVRGTAKLTAGSLVAHGIIIAVLAWATLTAGRAEVAEEQITFIEIPQEEPPPPPLPPPVKLDAAPPATPPVDVARGFQTLTLPDVIPPEIPPPSMGAVIREGDFSGRGAEGGRADGREGAPPVVDVAAAPRFIPFTLAPELSNREEVSRALQRSYPPLLRDAGIGGTTLLWFLIDEQGVVVRTVVKQSSGHDALDAAATHVAELMKFRPAKNRDRTVTVWIEIPIRFETR